MASLEDFFLGRLANGAPLSAVLSKDVLLYIKNTGCRKKLFCGVQGLLVAKKKSVVVVVVTAVVRKVVVANGCCKVKTMK